MSRARRSPAPTATRVPNSRRAAGRPPPAPQPPATDGTPVSASTRSERVTVRAAAASKSVAAPTHELHPAPARPRRRCRARRALANDVAIMPSASAATPARSSAAQSAASISRPMRRAGSPRRRRSWLDPRPLRDRHGRPPAGIAADGLGARQRDANQGRRRARRDARSAAPRSRSVTALTTRRPPERSAVERRIDTPGSLAPPPMKMASGGGKPAKRRPARCPRRSSSPGTPNAAALRRMRAARSGSALDGDRRAARGRRASIRSRPSRSPRRYPTAVRRGAAPAPTA